MIPALLTLATLAALMLSGCTPTPTPTPTATPNPTTKSSEKAEIEKALEDASRRMVFECIRLEGMPRMSMVDGRFLYCDFDLRRERERRERSKQ